MNDCCCNCNETDECFLGTEKKYLIEIRSAGFDMERDDFELVIRRGPNTVTVRGADMVQDEDGKYYVNVDTKRLGPGMASMVVRAHVPDMDCTDGIRDEVGKFDFLKIQSV